VQVARNLQRRGGAGARLAPLRDEDVATIVALLKPPSRAEAQRGIPATEAGDNHATEGATLPSSEGAASGGAASGGAGTALDGEARLRTGSAVSCGETNGPVGHGATHGAKAPPMQEGKAPASREAAGAPQGHGDASGLAGNGAAERRATEANRRSAPPEKSMRSHQESDVSCSRHSSSRLENARPAPPDLLERSQGCGAADGAGVRLCPDLNGAKPAPQATFGQAPPGQASPRQPPLRVAAASHGVGNAAPACFERKAVSSPSLTRGAGDRGDGSVVARQASALHGEVVASPSLARGGAPRGLGANATGTASGLNGAVVIASLNSTGGAGSRGAAATASVYSAMGTVSGLPGVVDAAVDVTAWQAAVTRLALRAEELRRREQKFMGRAV
jgi:hypothetical protein